MSKLERSIVSLVDPTIKTDLIAKEDTGSKEAQEKTVNTPEGVNTDDSARIGSILPLIVINQTVFSDNQIIYFVADFEGKIPEISVTVIDESNKFALDFPTDGDVISVYMRPPDKDNLKPIRIDYDITDVSSHPESKTYGFRGLMKIPGFFSEQCTSFKENNSFDHLKALCGEIGLGFASNETATIDSMSRLCAFETYETFVEETVTSTYKDDNSFFAWYIDPYYYLCLVNVNKQFDLEDKADQINLSTTQPLGGLINQTDTKDSIKAALILTNSPDKTGTNLFIESYSIESQTAKIWMNNGYKRYSQFYDIWGSKSEYRSIFVDPLTTPGAEKIYQLPKGRVDEKEFYQKQVKYKWIGKQAPVSEEGNVHDNYLFSKILNFQNLQEIKKTTLKIDLAGMNFYIYKYMKIPIAIYEQGNGKDNIDKLKVRDEALGEGGDLDKKPEGVLTADREGGNNPDQLGVDQRDGIKNEFLSGNYVVGGVKYTYQMPGPIKMSLTLIRREWPIPAPLKNY
jgi:hypothetical protein